MLLLAGAMSLSACLKRPDFMIRVDPAVVPLADAPRPEIAARVAELEAQVASGSLRGGDLRDAERELEQLRARLANGDFRVGDQLIVTVTRDQVTVDTATVREEMVVALTALPDFSVAGLLRSELQPRLQMHVDRYLVEHTVRANLLTRLQVLGAVGRPGFYNISPDRPVTELITLAGGPSSLANMDNVTVRRDGRLIVKASMWREASKVGTTVAQLGLRAGDAIEVEAKSSRNIAGMLRTFAFASTAIFGIIRLLQIVYAEPE